MTTSGDGKKNNKKYTILFVINTLINILLLAGLLIILGSLQQIYGKIIKIEKEHTAFLQSNEKSKEQINPQRLKKESKDDKIDQKTK